MCDLRAALSLAPGSPLRCGGFRRRQRLFVRSSGGALAHARLAALCFRSRPARRFAAAVSGGSKDFLCDLRCGALAHARFASSGGGFRLRQRLFVRPSGGALAHAQFAALRRRSLSARLAALCFGAAVSGGGKDFLCDLRCGAPARTRFAALCFRRRSRSARFAASGRRSRSRPVRRPLFSAALSFALGSPLCGGALAHARLTASVRRSRSRSARLAPVLKAVLKKTPALFFEHGRLLPHNFARFRQKARYSLLSFW